MLQTKEKTLNLQYHSLNSKTCNNKKVLVILSYDYFLQKRDLKLLSKRYQRTFLILKNEDLDTISTNLVNEIIENFQKIDIIFNPLHEKKKNIIYDLLIQNAKSINTITVYDFCEQTLKKCYIADNVEEETPNLGQLQYFTIIPKLIKKVVDVLAGLLIFIFTIPFWSISALKIYLESPGPVFYRQKRVGIRNCEFTIIKFRSMRLDAEALGAQFSNKNDSRIFPWGKIMRATRIDELPQLFNIIKGELSLVGPRPERKVFINSFEELIPHYNDRHTVKPGISGYAQIMYPYGAGVNDARHKLMYDLYYIKNWSIALEASILLRTVWTVIAKRGL